MRAKMEGREGRNDEAPATLGVWSEGSSQARENEPSRPVRPPELSDPMESLKPLLLLYGARGLSLMRKSKSVLKVLIERHRGKLLAAVAVAMGATSYIQSRMEKHPPAESAKPVRYRRRCALGQPHRAAWRVLQTLKRAVAHSGACVLRGVKESHLSDLIVCLCDAVPTKSRARIPG